MTDEIAARLEAALASIARPLEVIDWGGPRAVPIAVGWATVDLDRAAAEMRDPFDVGGGFAASRSDELLGATCRIGRRSSGSLTLVLLEPCREGRLAATLARHGEGPAAAWLSVPTMELAEVARVTSAARLLVSRPGDGPFGPEILLLGGPVAGPHLLLASPQASTIDR